MTPEGWFRCLSDAYRDPGGLDEAGAEFRRRNAIRESARQAAMQATSKEVVRRAIRTSSVPARMWSPGQWVYCFRRGKAGDTLHPTPRWVARASLYSTLDLSFGLPCEQGCGRCSPEQLRPAFPSEVLGRELASEPGLGELLRQVVSGGQAGAVDVSRELPPREDDHLRPVVKGCLWLRPHRRVMSQLPCQPRSSNLLYLQAFFQPHMCLRLYPLGLMQKEVERCRLVSPGGRLCRSRSGT